MKILFMCLGYLVVTFNVSIYRADPKKKYSPLLKESMANHSIKNKLAKLSLMDLLLLKCRCKRSIKKCTTLSIIFKSGFQRWLSVPRAHLEPSLTAIQIYMSIHLTGKSQNSSA